jgi:hypothetical protein
MLCRWNTGARKKFTTRDEHSDKPVSDRQLRSMDCNPGAEARNGPTDPAVTTLC